MIKDEDLEPVIEPFGYYQEAFFELSSTRAIGMGAGPIPFTAILEYFRIYEVGEFEDFIYLMRRMDSAFLDYQSSLTDKAK